MDCAPASCANALEEEAAAASTPPLADGSGVEFAAAWPENAFGANEELNANIGGDGEAADASGEAEAEPVSAGPPPFAELEAEAEELGD